MSWNWKFDIPIANSGTKVSNNIFGIVNGEVPLSGFGLIRNFETIDIGPNTNKKNYNTIIIFLCCTYLH